MSDQSAVVQAFYIVNPVPRQWTHTVDQAIVVVTEPRQLASTADIVARCNSNARPLADVRIVTSCKSGGRAISCSVQTRFCYLMLREQFLRFQYVFSKIS